ncbi:helix-turn-helix domain-containing protein [Nocardia grenadensis]|uniref:helix-turn-helix domain-containing protein n=1 Tax=Nocardia grenadensis TaxID=931537 RepID=UPI003D9332AE
MEGKVLGERIAAARKDRNLTQDHLASRVGIERTALGRIEKGERKVSAVELVDLAAVLEIPLAWLCETRCLQWSAAAPKRGRRTSPPSGWTVGWKCSPVTSRHC